MKTIVTHIGPGRDRATHAAGGWEEALPAFVPAGTTLGRKPADSDPEVMHVDTGFGKYDHHQHNDDTCAAQLVFEEIKKSRGVDVPMERLLHLQPPLALIFLALIKIIN